jgi:hypothetical protein
MRKVLIVAVTALAIALIVPTLASAVSNRFMGSVTPLGDIGFKYVKKHHKRKVVNLSFDGIPMDCNDGSHTTSGDTGNFAFKVHNKKFGDRLTNGAGATLNIHGKFTNNYHHASGTIRVHGHNVPTDPSGSAHGCDTGTDDWEALG